MAEPRNVPDYVAKSIFNGIDAVVLAIGLMSARFSDTASVDENIRRIYRAIGQAKIGYTSAEAEDEFGDTILAAVGHIRAVEKEKAESPKEWRKKVRSLERRLAKLHAMGVRDAVAGNEGGTNQQPRSNVVLTLGAAMQVARAREMATANNE